MNSYQPYLDASIETIRRAHDTHGVGLYALSSFGVDAAFTLSVLKESGVEVPVLTNESGFRFDETKQFQEELQRKFELRVFEFGPVQEVIDDIVNKMLWEENIGDYYERVKVRPLKAALRQLGVTALISGVRRYQTLHRASMNVYEPGGDGEVRVHPVLDWPEEAVEAYVSDRALPKHPFYVQGFDSVGDWPVTRRGRGRSGRMFESGNGEEKLECGIHLAASPA